MKKKNIYICLLKDLLNDICIKIEMTILTKQI